MNSMMQSTMTLYLSAIDGIVKILQPIVNIIARIYVAIIFFKSGLTKINDWESTLMLFEYEYSVPIIGSEIAAYLATIGELVLPILLIIGLTSRFSALGLLIVNIVAVISLEEIAPAAFNQHLIWGVILTHIILWGGSSLSIDQLIKNKLKQLIN